MQTFDTAHLQKRFVAAFGSIFVAFKVQFKTCTCKHGVISARFDLKLSWQNVLRFNSLVCKQSVASHQWRGEARKFAIKRVD